jgi:hypothetical protein
MPNPFAISNTLAASYALNAAQMNERTSFATAVLSLAPIVSDTNAAIAAQHSTTIPIRSFTVQEKPINGPSS